MEKEESTKFVHKTYTCSYNGKGHIHELEQDQLTYTCEVGTAVFACTVSLSVAMYD